MPSNGFSLELPIGKVSKVKNHHGDAIYSVDELGSFEGIFAIASSKKELKALMKSAADVVYDESKGKLYLNDNATEPGWGVKKVGGLLAKFKGKPELTADNFEGLSAHKDSVTSGGGKSKGDTKDKIASYRETLSDSEEADLLVDFTLEPKKALKRTIKDAKKDGYVFDRDELAEALDEMNQGGAFVDIELDAVAMEALYSQGGAQQQYGDGPC